jgi:transcription elongation factor GreA
VVEDNFMTEREISRVTTGTWVKLSGFVPGEEEVFHIVSEAEADVTENRIPPSSPLAQVLEGATVGDEIVFNPPAGQVKLKVLELGRP